MDREEILDIFKETDALLSGHFELRSGLHSNEYFQCALLLQHPMIAERFCEAAVEKLRADKGEDVHVDAVISPALGGIPVGHEVARVLGVKAIFAEKCDGVLTMRRFQIKPGEHYVVAEDVITRGGRVQETIDIVEAAGAHVVGVVVLVDRSEGKASLDHPVYSLLQMTPKTWKPDNCPLCKEGVAIDHPGS